MFVVRLLSAFRDKYERCALDWDCTTRKDWSVSMVDYEASYH